MTTLTVLQHGSIYPATTFTKFQNTSVDFLILQIVDNKPVATFQPKGTQSIMILGYAPGYQSSMQYIIKEGDGYRVIMPANAVSILNVYYTPEYRNWIKAIGYSMHEVSGLTLSSPSGMPTQNFPRIFVSRGRTTRPADHAYTRVQAFNPANLSATSKYWVAPGEPAVYANSITTYDIKLLTDTPWFTPEFRTTLSASLLVVQSVSNLTQTQLISTPKPTVTQPQASTSLPPPATQPATQPETENSNTFSYASMILVFVFLLFVVIGLWVAMSRGSKIA